MKTIGIVGDRKTFRNENYYAAVEACGAGTETLDVYEGTGRVFELDGIILPGGADVDPALYHEGNTRGFDDLFFVPHSGKMSVKEAKLSEIENLGVLASSEEAGPYLIMNRDGSRVFCLGHPEQDPDEKSSYQWRSHANALFSNWLNYYVYQKTPFELNRFVFE